MTNDTQIGQKNMDFLTTSVRTSPVAGPPVYKSIQTPDPYGSYPAAPTPNTVSVNTSAKVDPDKRQVGGDHYKKLVLQPIDLVVANKMGFCEGSVIKYICRHKTKGGVEDLRKAIHYIELLMKHEYGVSG